MGVELIILSVFVFTHHLYVSRKTYPFKFTESLLCTDDKVG